MDFLLLYLFSFDSPTFAQVSKNLENSQPYLIDSQALKSHSFLFIQEDCEACEKSLHQLSQCSKGIRSKMNLVVLESESWAQKKVKTKEVRKIQFANHYFMTREEAKKVNVRGTPTYLIGTLNELKPLSCQVVGQLQKQLIPSL